MVVTWVRSDMAIRVASRWTLFLHLEASMHAANTLALQGARTAVHAAAPPELGQSACARLLVAQSGESLSRLTHRPPLLTQAELNVLRRTGTPDTARIMRELGWRPTPFAEGLARTLTSLQRQAA
jgi:nucleoside-diphosphate-sugar epimerase